MSTEHHRAPLPRSTPEAQGVASSAVLAFVNEVEEKIEELHSFMLLHHGNVVAEGWWAPYGPENPHMLFSLSKSFTATAAGLAIEEGRLSLDAPVLSFFPEEAPAEVSENLAAMQVRHLLSMSSGNDEDTTKYLGAGEDGNWARAFLARPVEHTPGTHFVYNSGATYIVAAIVEKVTGMGLVEYLTPRLFAPLGIADPTSPIWETCPRGIAVGGWGLNVKTEDIARFGQLYLQKGIWEGKRLLPESWVEEATSRQVSNGDNPESDWSQGYGYQFWRSRHGAYRGDGAFGQYCVVMPDQDAALAITAGTGDMQAVLNLVWKHLLPALKSEPLPADTASQASLLHKLSGLKLHVPQGALYSPLAASVSGKTYRFEQNDQKIEAITLDFGQVQGATDAESSAPGCMMRLQNDRGEHTIVIGVSDWILGITELDRPGPRPIAAIGAWTTEDTYTVKLSYYETPFCPLLTCRFAEDEIHLNYRQNVAFGPTKRPDLVGRVDETVP